MIKLYDPDRRQEVRYITLAFTINGEQRWKTGRNDELKVSEELTVWYDPDDTSGTNDRVFIEGYDDYGSGKKLDLTESWSFENTTRTVSISGSDEVNGTWTEVTKFDNGMKNVETSGDLTNKDGDKLEFTQNFTYDKDGEADDKSDDSKPEEPAADTGYTGGYYGTYDYTAYWDGGKQKQGERSYYVFEYNGCYYLVRAKNPDDVKNRIKEDGVEGFFKSYYDDRLTVENAAFDPATRTATYLEKSYMNDVQYVSTVYTIVFDGKGGVTISWESQNVYEGQSEPQESGTFTGKKK